MKSYTRNPEARKAARLSIVRQISLGQFSDELESLENNIAYYTGKMRGICSGICGEALCEERFAEMLVLYDLHQRDAARAEVLRVAIDAAVIGRIE